MDILIVEHFKSKIVQIAHNIYQSDARSLKLFLIELVQCLFSIMKKEIIKNQTIWIMLRKVGLLLKRLLDSSVELTKL
jgi:hypothetical protein